MSPLAGMAVVLGALTAVALGLRALSGRVTVNAELLRKLFHIGAGLVSLSLPWLFTDAWPVVTMTVLSSSLLIAMRTVPALRDSVGNLIGGVGRLSLGELYFPISVCVLFLLSRDEPVMYAIPLLILTLADSLAALIGVGYGRFRYETTEGKKSLEGSAAFFLTAFFCTHIPLLLSTDTGRAESLLIALILGLLVMMLESVAWRGLDNLFVPLAAYALLHNFAPLDAGSLSQRFLLTVGTAAALFLLGRHSTLTRSGLVSAFLTGYFLVVVGGWLWLFPPLVLFLSYRYLTPSSEYDALRMHKMQVILAVNLVGLALVTLAEFLPHPVFYFAFLSHYAAHLAVIGMVRCQLHESSCVLARVATREALKAWGVFALLYAFASFDAAEGFRWFHAALLALMAILLLTASHAYARLVPDSSAWGESRWDWQAWCGAFVAAGAAALWLSLHFGYRLLSGGLS